MSFFLIANCDLDLFCVQILTVAATSDCVRDSDRQKVRHVHNVIYRTEYAHDDYGSLPTDRDFQQDAGFP